MFHMKHCLFTDTKATEDLPQHILDTDLSDQCRKVPFCAANIFGEKINMLYRSRRRTGQAAK